MSGCRVLEDLNDDDDDEDLEDEGEHEGEDVVWDSQWREVAGSAARWAKDVARGKEKQPLWTIKQLRDRGRAKAPLAGRQWND